MILKHKQVDAPNSIAANGGVSVFPELEGKDGILAPSTVRATCVQEQPTSNSTIKDVRTHLTFRAGQGFGQDEHAFEGGIRAYFSLNNGFTVVGEKRGHECVLGKAVTARPMNQTVFAQVYKSQKPTSTVSIAPVVLALAQELGAASWVIRHDLDHRCFELPLSEIPSIGWLKNIGGIEEYYVPLSRFEEIEWQVWPFVKPELHVDLQGVGN